MASPRPPRPRAARTRSHRKPLSGAERTALYRLGHSFSLPEGIVRLEVREASALERTFGPSVHEAAVKAHLKAMGPYRAETLVGELGKTDWDSLKVQLRRLIRPRRIGREEFDELERKAERRGRG